jgi:DNA-binding response OmpR family regulator
MHFSIVPIQDVPIPEAGGGAHADRPVVLVVEDDTMVANTLVDILNKSGYVAIAAYDGTEAIETAMLVPPHVVIADATLDGMSGIEVAEVLKSKLPEVKVVLLGAERIEMNGPISAKLEELAIATVARPVRPAALLETISATLKSGAEEPAVLVP